MSRLPRRPTHLLLVTVLFALLAAACGPAARPADTRTGAAETESAATGNRADLRVQVVGLLEALGPDTATVGGMRLKLNDATLLDEGVAPNQVVAAETVMGEAGLNAVAIHPAQAGQPASLTFELTGQVESQADDAWLVGGHRVQVPPAAELAGAPQVGDLVAIQGSTDAAGALVAREIRAVNAAGASAQDELEFAGLVTSLSASEWVIGGRTVQVTAQTEIKPGVALGVLVKVHALPQANGSLIAREIEPAPAGQQPTAPAATAAPSSTTAAPGSEREFTGTLSAINGDVWTIGGQAVRLTAATEVKGNLQLGAFLKVHASPGADGVLVAREVEHAAGADDDDSGRGGDDDNRGPGSGDDDDRADDNSGHSGGDEDNSGHGGGADDDRDDDNSGHGGGDDD